MNTIGRNIKKLRQNAGWGQSDVAKNLNISIPAYSKIEAGVTIINIKRLLQIADFFNVKPADILLNEKDNPTLIASEEINLLKEKLLLKDSEVIKLQQTAIMLYEELRKK
jgi:transcriptional regulator with XRE-family HTH domain